MNVIELRLRWGLTQLYPRLIVEPPNQASVMRLMFRVPLFSIGFIDWRKSDIQKNGKK